MSWSSASLFAQTGISVGRHKFHLCERLGFRRTGGDQVQQDGAAGGETLKTCLKARFPGCHDCGAACHRDRSQRASVAAAAAINIHNASCRPCAAIQVKTDFP